MKTMKKLLMSFKTEGDKTVSISVDSPRPDLTEGEIIDAMNLIVTNNIFAPNGDTLVSLVAAKIVETDTTAFDLVL